MVGEKEEIDRTLNLHVKLQSNLAYTLVRNAKTITKKNFAKYECCRHVAEDLEGGFPNKNKISLKNKFDLS